MADRYFVSSTIAGDRATLVESEAHHLANVMRAKPGARVILFDGSGLEFLAEVVQVGRSQIDLTILERTAVDRELPGQIVLGVALPKGDRQRWLVEKAAELGVHRLVLLTSERGVADAGGGTVVRLTRAVIEASKQCGRNRLMEIAPPQTFPAYVTANPDSVRLIAHPGGGSISQLLEEAGSRASEVRLAVGPEGGFTEDELELARQSGWQAVDLGPRILRVETAAIAMAAIVAEAIHSRPK